jgi:RNA 2',3'-cyclic 3'-phosphodiesterase
MSETWRIFAAVELTPEIKNRISETARQLADRGWDARWVKPDNMHMTVKFYGDTSAEIVPRLQDELRSAISGLTAFELDVSGVGAFPNARQPRVVWLGIEDPSEQLLPLKSAVERASGAAGLEEEDVPYKPHLTVARLSPRFRVGGQESVEALDAVGDFEPIRWTVTDVTLFQSKLQRGGSVYTEIERFPLAPPEPAGESEDAPGSDQDEEQS